MIYQLNEVHIQAAKTVLDQIGPCTLLDLAKHLKEQKICRDLDNVAFVCKLRSLVDNGKLDNKLVNKPQVMRGLTNKQKEAIQSITEEFASNGKTLTFSDLAQYVVEKTGEDNPTNVERKIRFLFIPMSTGEHDDEEYTS